MCIAEGYVLSDQRRPRRYTPEQYFKTQAEMAALFKDFPQALANSVEIAKRCNLALDARQDPAAALSHAQRCRARRIPPRSRPPPDSSGASSSSIPTPGRARSERARYRERLEFELDTIVQMGFPGYFLIVADFINWAKGNGVPVGPGRGSGAGSLVAYSLGITELDPLRYDLLFERFLNPERVSMPDFDIDFCQDGRDRVIEYVKQKYGADCVSQIATFGTMAAKAVVRDVGRVLDLVLHVLRPAREADPVPAGQAHYACRRARHGAAARGAREERGGGAGAPRARRRSSRASRATSACTRAAC